MGCAVLVRIPVLRRREDENVGTHGYQLVIVDAGSTHDAVLRMHNRHAPTVLRRSDELVQNVIRSIRRLIHDTDSTPQAKDWVPKVLSLRLLFLRKTHRRARESRYLY